MFKDSPGFLSFLSYCTFTVVSNTDIAAKDTSRTAPASLNDHDNNDLLLRATTTTT
jgi:hypothetical protein